ncbi:MAG: YDG domain-containing protein [Ferruginibacter sp.]
MKKFYSIISLVVLVFALPIVGWGQVSMTTSSSYSQNFNTLITTGTTTWTDNSTIANWYSQRVGTGTSIVADAGTNGGGNLYSYGTGTSSDRALGTVGSNNATAKDFSHGVLLRNTSGATITDLKISYTLEQWRNGNNTTPNTITFWYKISTSAITALNPNTNATWTQVTALSLSSPINTTAAGSLDGNAVANRVSATSIAIPSLSLADNSYIMLKWEDPDHSGTDHGLGIDDVTIAWTVTPACTAQTITAITSTVTKTYGDAAYSVSTSSTSGLTITYASSDPAVATVNSSGSVTIVGAGTTTITASQAGDATYCAATDETQTLTVNKKALTISGVTAMDKVYDGTTTATLTGTAALVGVLAADISNVILGGTPAANFASPIVGTGIAVAVTGYTISGSAAGNYSLTQPTGLTADITAPANSISTTATSFSSFCNGTANSMILPFSTTGTFTGQFNIQISNASGSFPSDATSQLLTYVSSTAASVTATIPVGYLIGSGYKVRVVNNAPTYYTSGDNGTPFTINTTPSTPSASTPAAVCQGNAVTITGAGSTGATTYTYWSATTGGTQFTTGSPVGYSVSGGNLTTPPSLTGGIYDYYLQAENSTFCSSLARQKVTVTVNALSSTPGNPVAAANPSCGATTLNIIVPPVGETYYWQGTTSLGTNTSSPTSSIYNVSSTGTYYVRSQTTAGCWSASSGNLAVNVVNSPSITTQPSDAITNTSAVSTFSVTATNASGYQWQVDNGTGWISITNNSIYSGATTSMLAVTSPPLNYDGYIYRCIVKANTPCVDLPSSSAQLTVTTGPCVSEGFESGLPGGYTAATSFSLGSGTWTAQANGILAGTTKHSGSYSCQLRSQSGAQVTSPNLTGGIANVVFWAAASTNTGSLQVNYSTDGGITWVPASGSPFALTQTANTFLQFTATINSTAPNILLQFYRTAATVYIDDVEIYCPTVACTSPATITDFKPTTAPVGALVTLTGTGFTGATAVKFGSVNATSYTVVSATKIIAKVPSNVPLDYITVTPNGSTCVAKAATIFTPIGASGCGTNGSGSVVNDLSISEVYDALSGSLSYIEIFNGTGATITLGAPNNYVVRVRTGTSTDNDYALTGTIASGTVILIRLGNSSTSCAGLTLLVDQPSASGFNGNDQIFLRKNGVDIDYVPNPGYPSGSSSPGFSQIRKATTTASTIPSTTYTSSDWTVSTTEDCSNLGIAPYTVSGNSVTITSQPVDINCTAITFSVGATSNPSPVGNYLWYYNDPSTMAGWLPASGLTNASNGITASNTNTANMTVTGNTGALYNYQFYATVSKNTCTNNTNAAQYTYSTRPIYASNVATGNWTTPGSWLMSYDNVTFVSTCSYPVSSNSSEVYIKAGHTITLPINLDIDKLTIQATGKLILNSSALLTVYDSTAGADLIVDGTLQDDGSSSNGLKLNGTATWSISSTGTIIKTGGSSASGYRDNYETGIANITPTANWIYRNTGSTITIASANSGNSMYYPNLTLENTIAGTYASAINNTTPAFSDFTLLGASNANTNIIKGNFNVGGAGTGNIYFASIDQTHLVNILGNLTINAGSTLINGNKTIQAMGFDLKGDLTLNGALSLHENRIGLLKFSGSTNQNITGSATTGKDSLWDVTVANNGNTLNLNKNISVLNALTFESAAKLNLNDSYLNLRSVDTVTARVAAVPSNAVISYGTTGRFVVERYYPSRRGWRLVTAPISAEAGRTFVNSWQMGKTTTTGEGTFISAPSAPSNGFDLSPLQNNSLQFYNGSGLYGIPNTDVNLISGTAGTATNFGMFLFVRGDRSSNSLFYPPYSNNTVLRDTGRIQLGNQTFSPVNALNSFSLLGNPYASPVNINTVLNASSGVDKNKFYIYDPFLNSQQGAYVYYTRGIPASSPWIAAPPSPSKMDTTLQSSQAFYVQHTAATASLIFTEADKVTATLPKTVKFRPVSTSAGMLSSFRTNLYLLEADQSTILADGVYTEFHDTYSNIFDKSEDALKFTNSRENLGMLRPGALLAVERRQPLNVDDTIFYNLARFSQRSYRLEFEPINLNTLLVGILEDKFTGIKTPIDLFRSSTFDFTVTSDVASSAPDRFRIVFKQIDPGPLPVTFTNVNAYEKAKNIAVEWTVENEINIREYEVEKSIDGTIFTKMSTNTATGTNSSTTTYSWLDVHPVTGDNYFRIVSIDQNGKRAFSRIVKVKIGKLSAGFTIYPNPVIGNTIGVQFNNMPAGKYKARLLNNLGQVLLIQSIEYAGGNSIQNITPTNTLAKGIYQLEIINPDKTNTTLKVIK